MKNFKQKVMYCESTCTHHAASVIINSWCHLSRCIWTAYPTLFPHLQCLWNESENVFCVEIFQCVSLRHKTSKNYAKKFKILQYIYIVQNLGSSKGCKWGIVFLLPFIPQFSFIFVNSGFLAISCKSFQKSFA